MEIRIYQENLKISSRHSLVANLLSEDKNVAIVLERLKELTAQLPKRSPISLEFKLFRQIFSEEMLC